MLFFYSAYRIVRRALEEDQQRPAHSGVPLWRLLAGEVAVLARRVGRWRVTLVVTAVAVAVFAAEVALSEITPGPVLDSPWRWIIAGLAAGVALAVWSTVQAVRATRETRDTLAGQR